MGSFFTNAQLRLRGLDASGSRRAVIDALQTFAATDGFVPCEASEPADRTILVAWSEHWASVYDEFCEDQLQGNIDALAAALSDAVGSPALSILVHDSDVLELRLFGAGRQLDRYCNDPTYLSNPTPEEKELAKGRPELWRAVLAEGADIEALRQGWATQQTFAEDTLLQSTRLFGLNDVHVQLGYTYADKSNPDYLVLRFRQSVDAAQVYAEQPTTLELVAGFPDVRAAVAGPLRFGVLARNASGSSIGVSVVVWGEALDRGLVVLDSVELWLGPPEAEQRFSAQLEDRIVDGKRFRAAIFEQAVIPPVSGTLAAAKARVHAIINGTGAAAGAGELFMGVVPVAEPTGTFTYMYSVVVSA